MTDKERFDVKHDGEHVNIKFLGLTISVHREEAERFALAVLQACQDSHDESFDNDPTTKQRVMDYDDWIACGKPMDGNLKITKGDDPKNEIVIANKLRRLVTI